MRSLIELPGLNVSSLASTVASVRPFVMALMRTSGVCPMVSRMLSQMREPGAEDTALLCPPTVVGAAFRRPSRLR